MGGIEVVLQTPEEENQLKAKKQFREDLKVFNTFILVMVIRVILIFKNF